MAQLRKRSEDCALCSLLYQAAKDVGLSDSDNLRCHRVESTIRVEPDGPTILSIYADPGRFTFFFFFFSPAVRSPALDVICIVIDDPSINLLPT